MRRYNELVHCLEVTDLSYRYPGSDAAAVEGLSFALSEGEILGVLGSNGAGKTTTLHAVLGLLTPYRGTIRLFGLSPTVKRSEVLRRLNFASAEVDLPSNLQVRECLSVFSDLYGVHDRRVRVQELLERFELGGFQRQLVGSLSSGEQMRLKLCKALLNEPDLLILDEPTQSLDPYMAEKVRHLLRSIQRERRLAILHTSHNMYEVETFCDRILFLHRGKNLAEGPPAEVLARFQSESLSDLFIRVARSGELVHVD